MLISSTGLFYRVCCDEAHKAKTTRSLQYHWIETLRPQMGYLFLTATPMPNTIEDLKCYLKLNWKPEWAGDQINPDYPHAAIGLLSADVRYQTDNPDEKPEDVPCPQDRGIMNPKLFHRLLDSSGGMDADVASRLLPAIQSQISTRRTMSDVVAWTDDDGKDHEVRIGASVPEYTCRVVELAYKKAHNRKRHDQYHQPLAYSLTGGAGAEGPHPESGTVGKRNMAAHKRLQVLTTCLHAERFTHSYGNQSVKTGLAEVNSL
jgi:hypothetical protein